MSTLEKVKPATVATVPASGILEIETFGRRLGANDNSGLRRLQAVRLSRQFALSLSAALLTR